MRLPFLKGNIEVETPFRLERFCDYSSLVATKVALRKRRPMRCIHVRWDAEEESEGEREMALGGRQNQGSLRRRQ